eukprot:scaffold417_cov252-Pinguiococcus_pyrenoidosus.AAC.7
MFNTCVLDTNKTGQMGFATCPSVPEVLDFPPISIAPDEGLVWSRAAVVACASLAPRRSDRPSAPVRQSPAARDASVTSRRSSLRPFPPARAFAPKPDSNCSGRCGYFRASRSLPRGRLHYLGLDSGGACLFRGSGRQGEAVKRVAGTGRALQNSVGLRRLLCETGCCGAPHILSHGEEAEVLAGGQGETALQARALESRPGGQSNDGGSSGGA